MKTKKTANKTGMALGVLGVFLLLGIGMVFAYQGGTTIQGPNYSDERHEAMTDAFDNLDYDAWASLMAENGRSPRVLSVVNEDNFEDFVEMHNAMHNGDMDLANELKAELGLGQGKMNRKGGEGFNPNPEMEGRGKGFMGNPGMQKNSGECPYGN